MSPNLICLKVRNLILVSLVVTPKVNREGDRGKERKRKASRVEYATLDIYVKVVLTTF